MKLPFKQVFAFHPGAMKYVDFKRTFQNEQGALMALSFIQNLIPKYRQHGEAVRTGNDLCGTKRLRKKGVEVSDIKILTGRAVKQP